jgi:hypothetical protein
MISKTAGCRQDLPAADHIYDHFINYGFNILLLYHVTQQRESFFLCRPLKTQNAQL